MRGAPATPQPDPDYRWMTPSAAARRLRLPVRALYRLVDRGALPAYRIDGEIRLRRAEVERYAAADGVDPGGPAGPHGA